MDEYDYLFVGKTLLAGGYWPSHSYIFGWDLNWLLLAWGETVIGGLRGARVIAAVFGLVSMMGMYAFVYTLWRNHHIALIAALLLGFESAHLYTSALATYDIICFTAFTFALPCLVNACQPNKNQLLWTTLSCTALSIAVLSKYIAIIYLPFLAALALRYSPRQAFMGILIITSVILVYISLNIDQLVTLYTVQIQGTHSANATHSDILYRTGYQLLVILFLAGFGLIYSVITRHVEAKKILALAAFSFPLFLYHLASQNVISLQKHLVFSSLFLIPIAAWWLHEYLNTGGRSHFKATVILACVGVYALINVDGLRTMRSSYPDIGHIGRIESQVLPTDKVLSENPYLFRYILFDSISQSQISETTLLDNNLDGKFQQLDVQDAVWDRKFDFVYLNDQSHQTFNTILRKILFMRNYELIYENRYQLETMSGERRYGTISLHRKKRTSDNLTKSQHASQSLM